jgi:ferric-dicitrate binding protein FerR (iron transport regulator)
MLSGMADVKAETVAAEQALDAASQNNRAAAERLEVLLDVARLAHEAQARRTRSAPPPVARRS